jgi:hypothetical protein
MRPVRHPLPVALAWAVTALRMEQAAFDGRSLCRAARRARDQAGVVDVGADLCTYLKWLDLMNHTFTI